MASPSDLTAPEGGASTKVLVTGLHGFTGRYVASALKERGYECFGLIAADGVPLNLEDADGVREAVDRLRPEYVIHLAAVAFVAHADVGEFYKTNILGTRNLLAALDSVEVAPRAVILASSANVYGNNADVPLSESSLVEPVNDYAVSKLAMEYMARTWTDRLPLTIVRPFNYTGVGQNESFLVPKLVSHFAQRKTRVRLGNLEVARDFSDVRVVADVYARLLTADVAGETYNVCSSKAVSLAELVDSLQTLTGHHIDIEVDAALVRSNEIKTLYGSGDRLRGLFPDYAPIPIEETLRWMIEAA